MFRKLLAYREEHGTLRFPSDEQCAATRNVELIELSKWAKGQVLSYRYGRKRNAECVRRLMDIGFDFDKWHAKPGKARGVEGRGKKSSKGGTTTNGAMRAEEKEAGEGDAHDGDINHGRVEDEDVEGSKLPAMVGGEGEGADVTEMTGV